MNVEPKTLDIHAIAHLAQPDTGRVWAFSNEATTWLQTDSVHPDQARWYLTKDPKQEAPYFLEIKPTAQSIVEALAHLEEKTWTNRAQLFEAMLPAIRAVAWSR